MTGTTFTLHRSVDPSNVSGTGVVAEGWESSSGEYVVLVWLSDKPSICIYSDIRHVEEIHGHEGDTQIVWDSPTQYTPSPSPEQYHRLVASERFVVPDEDHGRIAPDWEEQLGNARYEDPLETFDREDR